MSDSDLLNINGWILGDPYEHVFIVEISRNRNVSALKMAIQAAMLHRLKDICAVTLILYRVSILYTSQFAEHATALELPVNGQKMNALHKLSDVFVNGLLDTHVHVIVEIPSGAGIHRFVIVMPTLPSYPCRTTIQKAQVRL